MSRPNRPSSSPSTVVDHTSKVIGIVTFQLYDVQALNFAIPLRGIDLEPFVPLIQHKADPRRARVLEFPRGRNQMTTRGGRSATRSPSA